jgi:hypothetical protein
VDGISARLTAAALQAACQNLMREGEDIGGGVNALRLVKHLLDSPQLSDVEALWAYGRLKPALRDTFQQIPSLYYFEGD